MSFLRLKLFKKPYSGLLLAFLAALTVNSGCHSPDFKATNLPIEYFPAPTIQAESLNLGGMAASSISQELIQPNDVLEVSMVTDYEKLTATVTPLRVADDGTIIVPLVGRVNVAGMEVDKAEQVIAKESITRGVFRNPSITVTMKEFHTYKITVLGAVDKPGTVNLPRGSCSLFSAIVAAGGLTKDAGEEVEIRRTDSRDLAFRDAQNGLEQVRNASDNKVTLASHQQPAELNPAVLRVSLLSASQGVDKLPELHDGDVVNVTKRKLKPVYVLGLVTKPGEYPYPADQDLRVLDAIAMAGGSSNMASENILVIRHPEGRKEPVRIAVSLTEAKNGKENIPLAPGDIVSIERTPATAVVDFFQTFIRVGLGSSFTLF